MIVSNVGELAKSKSLLLLICAICLPLFANADFIPGQNLKIDLNSGSNAYYLQFSIENTPVDIAGVEVQEAVNADWLDATEVLIGNGFWTLLAPGAFGFQGPLSLRLTATDGQELTSMNVLGFSDVMPGLYDFGSNFEPPQGVSGPSSLGVLLGFLMMMAGMLFRRGQLDTATSA